MKIWILGANGQLGKAVKAVCEEKNIPYLASSRLEVDITELGAMKYAAEKSRCSHVINCAAFTDVDGAEKNSKLAYAVNALGPENVGRVAKENGMHVLHVSTDYIFDGFKRSPYLETDRAHPLGVYGKSKWEGELRVQGFIPSCCIVRTSWIFGRSGKNFISFILSKLQNEEKILAVQDQINRATYDKDLARTLIDLSAHKGIFHFANSEPISRYQIVKDFFEEAKRRKIPLKCKNISPCSLQDFPPLSPRPLYSALDTKKVTDTLGRKPQVWETVLGEYFDNVQKGTV